MFIYPSGHFHILLVIALVVPVINLVQARIMAYVVVERIGPILPRANPPHSGQSGYNRF